MLLLITPAIQAASFSSVQSGDWSNAATWGGGGVPAAGDSATVNTGHTVSVSSNQAVSSLVVDSSGTLTVAGGSMLTVDASIVNVGSINGGGTLQTQGTVSINNRGGFSAPLLVQSGTTSVSDNSDGTTVFDGAISVAAGATLDTVQQNNSWTVIATGDVNVAATGILSGLNVFRFQGQTFTNNGTVSVSSFEFNRNGAQTLAGTGTWTGNLMRVGSDANANASNTSLANAVTVGVVTFRVETGCTLSVTFPLSINGANVNNSGTISLSDTLTVDGGVTPGKTLTNFGNISGNGTLQTQGTIAIDNRGSFSAPLLVQGGTTSVSDNSDGTTVFDGAISVAAGATLDTVQQNNSWTVIATGDVNVAATGTLSGLNVFRFQGQTFTNNGTVSVSSFEFNRNGVQTLAGTGTWTGNLLRVGSDANANASNTSLANAVTVGVVTFRVETGCTLSVTFPLSVNGANFINSSGGTVSLSNTLTVDGGVTPGKTLTNLGTISGNGTLQTQGTVAIDNRGSFSAPLLVQSGTTSVSDNSDGTTVFDGAISVAAGATLSTVQQNNAWTVIATGDVNVAATGTISGLNVFRFQGQTFTNNGILSVSSFEFNRNGGQTLTGTGSFVSNLATVIGGSTVTLGSNHQMSTVVINSGGAFDITGRSLGLSGSGTPLINNGVFTTTGSTIVYDGSSAQDARTINVDWSFNNLTIDNAAGVSLSTAEVIPGTLTLANGVFTINGNLTLGNGALIRRSDGALSNAPIFGTSVNVEYFGANPITTADELPVSASVLNDLTINNVAGVSLNSDPQVNGTLSLAVGPLSIGAHTLTLNGAINSSSGNLIGGNTSNITFAGSGSSTTLPSVQNGLNNLTINRANGVLLGADLTLTGVLALITGDLTTGSSTLTMPFGATSTGTTDVVGNVRRTGFISGTTFSFGNPDNQITIISAPATSPTSILVTMAKSIPAGFPTAIQRNYSISPTGGVGAFTATLRLHYLPSELNGNTESALKMFRFDGSSWKLLNPTTPVNTSNHWVESNSVHDFSVWTLSSAPTATNGMISGRIVDNNGKPIAGAVVRLSGTQNRKFITNANGVYTFENVETGGFYVVTPSRANYNFNPSERSVSPIGNKTEASFSASALGDNANPLDTPEYFVRQQYVDMLDREPDEAGFNYWSDRILACGWDPDCVNASRRAVAAAFFIETEGQQTGSFIYDLYSGVLGRRPTFAEYSSDRLQVAAGANLEVEKKVFAEAFVQRAEFVEAYQTSTNAESFVDTLLAKLKQQSGVDLSSRRDSLITAYNDGGSTVAGRASVVRAIADDGSFKQSQYSSAFVLMEYFAYLRRDADRNGYDFWVNVLNDRTPGNYLGMVCSFITSAEYQQRFSSVVSHTNGECQR